MHDCEHEQQCKDLKKQVEDDAKMIGELLKGCQGLKDATSIEAAADATVTDAKAGYEGDLATKDAMITELEEERAQTRAWGIPMMKEVLRPWPIGLQHMNSG